ncbi:transposase [Xenorhabdus stockiae]|uniref:Transposase n=2 Tax=Xenorhabdus TaxID=626 RepID=A0A2D0KAV5_9GAMM|nr:IS5 family transposase [Xenorhabdus stockiae]PHM60599.1 transposase [Xenorhabdus stockiae]
MLLPHSALKKDKLAAEYHRQKIDELGDPLLALDKYVDFLALAEAVDRAVPRIVSPKGGRPPFPTEVMVRIIILKHFHNLSDEKMEYQLLDRMSWQRFCRLTDVINIPDRNTIWCFEKRLGQEGANALFEEAKHQLSAQGFIPRGGQIIDATLIPVPKQRNKKEENEQLRQGKTPDNWTENKRCQKDTEATWTKKHGKNYFGYKLTINVDVKYKIIRQTATGTASAHDSQYFEDVLDRANTSRDIYADKGYASHQREQTLKRQGYRVHIQRKASRNNPLSNCQKGRNKKISRTRARVEHIFGSLTQMGEKFIRTIGQLRANFTMMLMVTCYDLQRLVYFGKSGIHAF